MPLNLPKKFMKLALNINIKYRRLVFSTILTSRKRLWTISGSKRKGRNRIIPVKKIYVLSCVRNRTIQITLLSHLDFNCSHFWRLGHQLNILDKGIWIKPLPSLLTECHGSNALEVFISEWLSEGSTKCRSSHQRFSVRKGVLRNFAKFTEKHLCQSLFFKSKISQNLENLESR